jgi:hypothetical protein
VSWVEELKPDDDVEVEIIYPREYVEYSKNTIRKYTRGISYLCKGAAILGEDETEFLVWDMTVLQANILEEAMRQYGIEMTHDYGRLKNGRRWTYFYADVSGLRKILEEFDSE